jgi:hypothetical protein
MAVASAAAVLKDSTAYRSTVLRVGAACAVVGPILAIIVNILHPRPSTADVGKHEEFARMVSEHGNWVAIHVMLIIAFILFLGGLVALAYSLDDGVTSWLARPALVAALVGTAIGLVQASTDLAARQTSTDWASASAADKENALRVVAAVEDIDFLLLSVELVLFFGVAFILYGLAVAASSRYPSRLGWIAVVVGVGSIGVGIAQAFHGRASMLTVIGIPIVAGALSLWLLVMGVLLWRRESEPPLVS